LVAGFLGTLAVLAVVGFFVFGRAAPRGPVVAPAPTPHPTPPSAPLPAAVAPPPAPVPAPRAELAIDSDPQGAAVTIDGEPIGATPVTRLVDADGREHVVRLELAGYRAEVRQIVADHNRGLAVALHRLRDRPARPMDIKEGR
jgi:hypothetical protein